MGCPVREARTAWRTIAAERGSLHRFHSRCTPPERVFALWTDLGRMGEWVGGVTGVTDISGPVDRAGTTYVVHFGPMKSPTEILDVDPPRRFVTRFGSWLLRGRSSAESGPDGDGTRVTQDFQTIRLISAISAWVFSRGSYEGSPGRARSLRASPSRRRSRDPNPTSVGNPVGRPGASCHLDEHHSRDQDPAHAAQARGPRSDEDRGGHDEAGDDRRRCVDKDLCGVEGPDPGA